MAALRIALTTPAFNHAVEALVWSGRQFGVIQAARYCALLEQAMADLAENPRRHGVDVIDGRLHYHIRHSYLNVPEDMGWVKDYRHLIVARVIGEDLVILVLAHDSAEDELRIRIQQGEADL